LLNFRLSFNIACVHVSSGQYMTQILPLKMLHEMIVIDEHVFESVSFRFEGAGSGSAGSPERIPSDSS